MSKVNIRTRDSRRLARRRMRPEKLPPAVSARPGANVPDSVPKLRTQQTKLETQNKELRRIQLELENSRDRYAHLYNIAPVGYLTLDEEGVIRETNLTAARLLGLDRRALLKKKLSRFVAAESQADYHRHCRQVFATATPQSCDLQMRRPGGETFAARLESVAEPAAKGGSPQWLVALSDVTRQRQAENALRASQAQLAGIIRSAMDAILTVNSRQRIILCNEAAEQMFGRASCQLLGRPLDELIPKAVRQAHARHIRNFGASGVTNRRMGAPGRAAGLRADGTEFPIEASISQIEHEGEKFFTVVLRDVSDRARAEAALQRDEAALDDFFTEAPFGLLWVGPDGRILRVNRAQLELLGRTGQEVYGQPLARFLAEPEAADDVNARLARKEVVSNHRALLRRKDGSTRHVLIDANGLWTQGLLMHSRWFVRDISRRIELQTELLQIGERERQRIGQDLHDGLGQQLHGLSYLATLLEKDLREDASPHVAQSRQLNKYLQEALELTRGIAHGLQPVKSVPEGLMIALRELAERTRELYQVDCRFECRSPVLILRPNAATHLFRIAQEAVNNAMKHGKPTRIRLRLAISRQRILLGVRDNGLGIRRRTRNGRGMGLHVMQYRADAVNGSLLVQKLPEGGTEVVCTVARQALLPPTDDSQ